MLLFVDDSIFIFSINWAWRCVVCLGSHVQLTPRIQNERKRPWESIEKYNNICSSSSNTAVKYIYKRHTSLGGTIASSESESKSLWQRGQKHPRTNTLLYLERRCSCANCAGTMGKGEREIFIRETVSVAGERQKTRFHTHTAICALHLECVLPHVCRGEKKQGQKRETWMLGAQLLGRKK